MKSSMLSSTPLLSMTKYFVQNTILVQWKIPAASPTQRFVSSICIGSFLIYNSAVCFPRSPYWRTAIATRRHIFTWNGSHVVWRFGIPCVVVWFTLIFPLLFLKIYRRDGLWLNESFASYMAALAIAEATRFGGKSWLEFHSSYKRWAYREDQLSTTHPIQVISCLYVYILVQLAHINVGYSCGYKLYIPKFWWYVSVLRIYSLWAYLFHRDYVWKRSFCAEAACVCCRHGRI